VEDNVSVEWSLLCSNVKIFLGASISKGCVLSFDVCVGPEITLKSHSRLIAEAKEDCTHNIDLGDQGHGCLWTAMEEEQSNALHISGSKKSSLPGGEEMDEDYDGFGITQSGSVPLDEVDGMDTEDSEFDTGAMVTDFELEVREIVLEGVELGHSVENMALEINGRKFAHDKTFFECAKCILWAFLQSVPESVGEGKPLLSAFQKVLKKNLALLQKFVQEGEEGEVLWALQEFCEEKEFARYLPTFQFILHTFYDLDIVDEDAIWAWEKEQEDLVGEDRKFLEQCAKFLEWLRTADESSEEE
jgi:translation initiation factor eIF-2B subunit epsilon